MGRAKRFILHTYLKLKRRLTFKIVRRDKYEEALFWSRCAIEWSKNNLTDPSRVVGKKLDYGDQVVVGLCDRALKEIAKHPYIEVPFFPDIYFLEK